MPRTAEKRSQVPWNCRWVRIGDRMVGIPERRHFDGFWLCLRTSGESRYVTEEECATCQFWVPDQPDS